MSVAAVPVRRLELVILALVLAAGIHADWHFARPLHHRLSLAWREHWIFAIALFAVVGYVIARRWPAERWRAGIVVFALALVIAQVIEPLLESAIYDHALGYDVEPERWRVFAMCLLAGVPAYWAALRFCVSSRRSNGHALATRHDGPHTERTLPSRDAR